MSKDEIIKTYGNYFEDFIRKVPDVILTKKNETNWKLLRNKELFQKYLDNLQPTMSASQENLNLNETIMNLFF